MNAIEKFANIDKKFSWSFLGFLLALFFGGLTIYNEFIKVHDPQMVVEVLSDTNVLDLRENLPELKILYGEVDIKSVGKDLSVMVFRIKNVGGASILGGFYDANSPVTISLSNGEFLKFEKIGSSNEYLSSSANATKIGPSSIRMPNVIMEPGESYTIKALVIHGARAGTLIKSSGKIAGMRNIPIVRIEPDKENESFWSKVFSGTIGVQAARAPIYFIGFIFAIVVTFVPVIAISDALQERARKKSIAQFRKHTNEAIPDGHEAIFDCYASEGLAPLVRARKILGDLEELKDVLEKQTQRQRSSNEEGVVFVDNADYFFNNHRSSHILLNRESASRIIKKAAIATIEQDGRVQIDASKERFLGRFIDYITIKES